MKNLRACLVVCLFATLMLPGQTPAPQPPISGPLTTYSTKIHQVRDQLRTVPYDPSVARTCRADPALRIVSIECTNQLGFFNYLAGYSSYKSFLRGVEEFLSKHDPGSTTSSSGSTSLVSKASVPEV